MLFASLRARLSRSRFPVAIYGFYLLVAVFITWPVAQTFSTRLIGHPFSDSYEYARHIWWLNHALANGEPIFFQPLLAYPDGLSGAWLWGNPLQSFPAWLFAYVMPLPAAFNLAALLTLALNGWAMYWLVWKLTAVRTAALLAGLIFLAYPTFQGQLAAGHTGLLVLWPAPLLVYGLQSLVSRQRSAFSFQPSAVSSALNPQPSKLGTEHWALSTPHWLLATGCLLLSLLGNNLLVIYLVLPLVALIAGGRLWARDWRGLGRLLIVTALGLGIALVFIGPVAAETLNQPTRLSERNDVFYSADLLSVVTPSFQHPVFGQLAYTHRVLGVDPFEKPGYIGLIAGLLGLIGSWKVRPARPWLLLALVAWLFSLGPLLRVLDAPLRLTVGGYETHIVLPWALLQNLPLLNIARTPARFNFSVAFAIAVMAGYGAAWLGSEFGVLSSKFQVLSSKNLSKKRVAIVGLRHASTLRRNLRIDPKFGVKNMIGAVGVMLLVVGVVWEYQVFWRDGLPAMYTIPGEVPEAIQNLRPAGPEAMRPVFDVPWSHLLTDKDALYLQTGHRQPLLAGHLTRRTPVNPAKLTILQSTLDPALLNQEQVRTIILHKQWAEDDGQLAASLRAKLGAPFYDDERIAAFNVPISAADTVFTAVLTPPTAIADRAESYIFAPEMGWASLNATLDGRARDITVYLDERLIQRWTINGETAVELPLPLGAGYHTVTLAVEPACPANANPTLRCRTVSLSQFYIGDFVPTPLKRVAFERGVELRNVRWPLVITRDEPLPINLWWRFDQARRDDEVRFVHLLDAQGKLVAQADDSLGTRVAGTDWIETVSLPLPADTPPGVYSLHAGWYTYPALTRFCVLAAGVCSPDDVAVLGTVRIGEKGN